LDCEKKIPGFAVKMLSDLASLSGKEKYLPHYEQLLQRLAELLIIRQIVTFPWPEGARFSWEPTAGSVKKNPELLVTSGEVVVGYEVKAPCLINHIRTRAMNRAQLPARIPEADLVSLAHEVFGSDVTLPRDNPMKDFLISADEKFSAFREENEKFVGILVVVWDDYVYEPVSSLLHESSGLFSPNSFARGPNDEPLKFTNVEGVVLVRHLHQLIRAAEEAPLFDSCHHALDYGRPGEFPPKVFIQNPRAESIEAPSIVLESLQAEFYSPEMGAEYLPQDLVHWISSRT